MTKPAILIAQDMLYTDYIAACRALSAFIDGRHNAMGLTNDDVKASPEYRALRAERDAAFTVLRHFNTHHAKAIKKARKLRK